jgi:hypothetical protein
MAFMAAFIKRGSLTSLDTLGLPASLNAWPTTTSLIDLITAMMSGFCHDWQIRSTRP